MINRTDNDPDRAGARRRRLSLMLIAASVPGSLGGGAMVAAEVRVNPFANRPAASAAPTRIATDGVRVASRAPVKTPEAVTGAQPVDPGKLPTAIKRQAVVAGPQAVVPVPQAAVPAPQAAVPAVKSTEIEQLFQELSANPPQPPRATFLPASAPESSQVSNRAALGAASAVTVGPPEARTASSVDRRPEKIADAVPSGPGVAGMTWLPTATSMAHRQRAAELIGRASHEVAVRAWASAEASAWEALRIAAQSVDSEQVQQATPNDSQRVGSQSRQACSELETARTAILESRGFSSLIGSGDDQAVARLIRSHQTSVLKGAEAESISASEAIDRYLNDARRRLAGIAAVRVEAAEAMDLLAAIHLARDEPTTLPGPTALCLRRAAFQGQSENASLATQLGKQLRTVGLYEEAEWVLERSLALDPVPSTAGELIRVLELQGNRERADLVRGYARGRGWSGLGEQRIAPSIPDVLELTPTEFAAISKPVMTGDFSNRSVGNQVGNQAVGSAVARDSVAAPAKLTPEARVASRTAWQPSDPASLTTPHAIPATEQPGSVEPETRPGSPWRRLGDSVRRFW